MQILYMCIGYTNPETNEFVFQKAEGKAEAFLRKLLEHTVDNGRTRVFQFCPDEVVAEIVLSYAQAMLFPLETSPDFDLDAQSNKIVRRLLDAENKANKQLDAMNKKVKSGSIVLSLLRDDAGVLRFVFAKVDHTRYLEGANLELHTGFSVEDRDIWKTAVVQVREEQPVSVGDVLVYMDRPAKYWTDWFLGLMAIRTDAFNSSSMYKAVCATLKREVEKVSMNDYLILWQTLVHRINSGKEFDYNEFVYELIDNYKPQTAELDEERLNKLKGKLLGLPESSGFDRQFVLEPGDVASLAKVRTVKISSGIELRINREVDVRNTISEVTDENGNRYIRIRCIDGNAFDEMS